MADVAAIVPPLKLRMAIAVPPPMTRVPVLELTPPVRLSVPLMKFNRDQSGVVVSEPVVTVPPLIVRLLKLFQTVMLVAVRTPPLTLRLPVPPLAEVLPPI